MTERKIFGKYANFSENELNPKNVTKNDVMTAIIKRCKGEKKGAKEKWMYLKKN